MFRKDLKKLSRRELVDVIYQMKKNEQQLQEEITTLQEALQDKRIKLSAAGSVAEAAADISQLLSAAQKTADLYLHEITSMKADTEQECSKMIAEAHRKVQDILAEGKKQFAHLNTCYQADYRKLQLLREEIQLLEQQKNESCEG